MEKLESQVADRLTRYYIVALTLVAVLTVSGLFLIRRTINNLNHDSRIVNVAGRQRMLSQRLTKLAILQTEKIPTSDSVKIDSLLNIWKVSHEQLLRGRIRMESEFVVLKSDSIKNMYRNLEPVFQTIYTNLLTVINKSVPEGEKKKALRIILTTEPVFLNQMDAIVFQFDRESYGRIRILEQIEWILDILTLIVLLAEGILIFRPVVNTTRRVVRLLAASEDAVRVANKKLKIANSQLIRAQDDLIRSEEEKYQLQLAENRVRAAALIEGQEEERKRFALELHDGIGQMLTGLKLQAEKLKQMQFDDEKYRLRFDKLVALIQDTIQTTRQVSFNLMPSVLSDFGLSAALNLLCKQMEEMSGISVKYYGTSGRLELSKPMETGLYRIAQEALNNAVKHSESDNIKIKLEQNTNQIFLEIEDDGKGFLISNLKNKNGSILTQNGIENIRTRTQLLNGEMKIISNVDTGTRLVINIPI
ncbi:histidine kinase [Dyadobacter subterraneus]|uniref:histidine kinase n=1 Tax=Dyadobacter subterraneus TaxID=2773304 RepID=A0ABR9W5R3_9BACT|nr:histidine kinase [Dyadobacter subterraneus]MBE9460790.1 type IV pili methyl-accepting chemotaxis transducer N-terminal domain-containing protein [Dyadobacter subterraneus]